MLDEAPSNHGLLNHAKATCLILQKYPEKSFAWSQHTNKDPILFKCDTHFTEGSPPLLITAVGENTKDAQVMDQPWLHEFVLWKLSSCASCNLLCELPSFTIHFFSVGKFYEIPISLQSPMSPTLWDFYGNEGKICRLKKDEARVDPHLLKIMF